jgi:transposase-like protein
MKTLYSENIAPKTAVVERIYGSDGLNERQRIAANYLARGTTIRETARKIGVSEKSVYLWRQRTAVQQAIARIQQELLSETGGMNISTIPDAIKLLDSIINDPEARNTDRIAAARTLMSGAQAYQERKILERQINDLERQLLRFTATQNAATNATPIDPTEDDELLLDAADDDSLLLNILDSD